MKLFYKKKQKDFQAFWQRLLQIERLGKIFSRFFKIFPHVVLIGVPHRVEALPGERLFLQVVVNLL